MMVTWWMLSAVMTRVSRSARGRAGVQGARLQVQVGRWYCSPHTWVDIVDM